MTKYFRLPLSYEVSTSLKGPETDQRETWDRPGQTKISISWAPAGANVGTIILGYGYHEAFKGCVNVDECTDGNFPNYCGPNTICTDTVGSFTCACKPGIYCHCQAQISYLGLVINCDFTWVCYLSSFLCSGFTSWAAYSGCRDRNECCVGSYAECSHTCTRTSATSGLCINNAGSYSCGTCSTGGSVRWH